MNKEFALKLVNEITSVQFVILLCAFVGDSDFGKYNLNLLFIKLVAWWNVLNKLHIQSTGYYTVHLLRVHLSHMLLNGDPYKD